MPTTFANTIDGNDIFAKRAECDAAGNDLSNTYATKSELPDGVPAVTSSDDGKVLKASYTGGTGSFSWETESGGGGGGSYTAGTGIDITNDVISVDTSVVATQTDLAGKEDVFTVGTGLEMDTTGGVNTLQVETPVDIVAGPGIVIDNPDGNTLRVSVAQDEEVVLWSGAKYWWSDTSNLSLSEAASNFEVIRVKVKDDWELPHKFIFFPGENAGFDVSLIGCEGGSLAIKTSKFSVSGSTVSLAAKFRWQVGSDKTVSVGTDTSFIQFSEIVGIHRIAGGN